MVASRGIAGLVRFEDYGLPFLDISHLRTMTKTVLRDGMH